MAAGLMVAFWGVSALFVLTPGADWAYAMSAGVRTRSPVPAVLGMLAGHLLAAVMVAAGAGALIAGAPGALVALTVAGAAYLVWLGVGLVRSPAAPATEAGGVPVSALRQGLRGLGVSGLNPKVFLLFLALLPQFVDPEGGWPSWVQMLLLGAIHVASCAVVYLLVGFGARRVLRARPRAARIVTRIAGVLMIVLGVVLAAEQLVSWTRISV